MTEISSHIMSVGIHDGSSNPWDVNEARYPASGTTPDRLRFLLQYAVLAPSIHNSQPWLFRISNAEAALMADRSRALPVVDPDDRFLIMSCGAALMNLRIAMQRFSFSPVVRTFPELTDPDVLAYVRAREGPEAGEDLSALFRWITRRRTVRRTFAERIVPAADLSALESAAAAEGAVLTVVTRKDLRREIASIVSEADRRQREDRTFRRELASWVHPNRSRSHDGLPGSPALVRDTLSGARPVPVRTFDIGGGTAANEDHILAGSPVLAVLSTPADREGDWLAAGQALERFLLEGTARGLSFSFLNQPVEIVRSRSRLAEAVDCDGRPQVVVRLGYARRTRPSPRRPVTDILVHPGYNP